MLKYLCSIGQIRSTPSRVPTRPRPLSRGL